MAHPITADRVIILVSVYFCLAFRYRRPETAVTTGQILWRLAGIASAEIEAHTEAWCEAFRVQLGRQTVAVVGAIKEARASTKH